jgi:serralysin
LPDIPGDSTTTASITVGGTVNGTLETAVDHDWFRIDLTAGQSITVFVDGTTLEDSYLRIHNAAGTVLYENDDINPGIVRDSRLSFTATSTGTYYIDVGSFEETYAGDYQVSVSVYTPPPLATYDQIANQLVEGYWGGDDHHFNVSQGGSLTVNVTGLTAAGKTLAREALKLWGDVIGVQFVEVTSGGQITFNDDQPGAFTDGSWSSGIISSSHVNISTQWLADYGTGLNSYSFQSYVHEIGHALGLGHAGNYNGSATYPYDASFQNDAWVTSIMSYFSPTDNTYFAGQGFTENFVVTPMMADIVAMQTLYGLSTTTRTGDTIYGFHSTAGRAVYDASANPTVGYTIFDSGGTDTLDYSGFGTSQTINLNPETFSNVGSGVGNVAIARGVVIENAVGGSGSELIIGNSANNILDGGGGNDTVSYETASAGVTVDLSTAAPQNTIAAGVDTVQNFENLRGSAFGDVLTARGSGIIWAGAGNDVIHGSIWGGDHLYGESGDDTFVPGKGFDFVDGGVGWDTVDFSAYASGVTADLGNQGPNSYAFYTSVEQANGSAFDDRLAGTSGANILNGAAGNDALDGALGDDAIDGGSGSDTASYASSFTGVSVSLALAGAPQATGDTGSDTLVSIENLSGSFFNDSLTGDSGNNVLTGLDGNDVLNGGVGSDTMVGGFGDDKYYIADPGDVVVEAANQGDDMVFVLGTYTLAQGVSIETLVALNQSSTDPLVLTGNEFGQSLYGNLGDNYLNGGQGNDFLVGLAGNDNLLGGTGADDMQGGTGNDVYYADQAGDRIFENAGEGSDLVVATASYTLTDGAAVETMSADPNAGNINLTGNEFAQSIYGNAGNNNIAGMGGADFLVGGAGNDTYYVDPSDFIGEDVGGGDDTIVIATSYILREGNEIETLVALNQSSTDPVNLTGNEFGQSLYGSQGNNMLNGGGGNDFLVGLGGNDFLIGGPGNDNMAGGAGNDLYYVEDSGDQIFENAGEGDDLAVCFASFALGAGQSVETLSAAEGSSAIDLTGNALGQSLYGNAGANVLSGNGGADYLSGSAGNDTFVLANPNGGGIASIADYASGDVVDVTQVLSVAAGTDLVGGGYLRISGGGQIQVDTNGGGDQWVSLSNINGSASVTIRYLSGGTPTDLSVAHSASAAQLDPAAATKLQPSTGIDHDAAALDPAFTAHDAWHLDPLAIHHDTPWLIGA